MPFDSSNGHALGINEPDYEVAGQSSAPGTSRSQVGSAKNLRDWDGKSRHDIVAIK
jgi:hypothetical protein